MRPVTELRLRFHSSVAAADLLQVRRRELYRCGVGRLRSALELPTPCRLGAVPFELSGGSLRRMYAAENYY